MDRSSKAAIIKPRHDDHTAAEPDLPALLELNWSDTYCACRLHCTSPIRGKCPGVAVLLPRYLFEWVWNDVLRVRFQDPALSASIKPKP
jgi:hypothetical protein